MQSVAKCTEGKFRSEARESPWPSAIVFRSQVSESSSLGLAASISSRVESPSLGCLRPITTCRRCLGFCLVKGTLLLDGGHRKAAHWAATVKAKPVEDASLMEGVVAGHPPQLLSAFHEILKAHRAGLFPCLADCRNKQIQHGWPGGPVPMSSFIFHAFPLTQFCSQFLAQCFSISCPFPLKLVNLFLAPPPPSSRFNHSLI